MVFMRSFLRIVFPLLLGVSTSLIAAEALDKIVVTVDNEVITQNQLDERLSAWERQMASQGNPIPEDKENQQAIKKQMMESLINERLQILAAERYGITVEEQTVDQTLASIAKQNNMDMDEFREAIKEEGLTYEKFRAKLQEELLLSRVQQSLVSNQIIVSDQEIDEFLKKSKHLLGSNQEYHVGHILIAMDENPSSEELKATQKKADDIITKLREGADFAEMATKYSNSGSALKGGDLGWYKAGELPSLFGNVVPRMKVGDVAGPIRNPSGLHIVKLFDVRASERKTEVQQYEVSHILIQTNEIVSDEVAKSTLTELYKRIESGEDFAALARTYSEDPGSAKQGGSIGWVDANSNLDEAFFAEVQKTPKGEMSAPFKSSFGWHIVRVEDQRVQDQTAETQRQAARRMIQSSKSMEEMQTWLTRLRDESTIEIRDPTLQDKDEKKS